MVPVYTVMHVYELHRTYEVYGSYPIQLDHNMHHQNVAKNLTLTPNTNPIPR